jgi:hypothetical protein
MKNNEDMILGRTLIMTLINFMGIFCVVTLCGYDTIHSNVTDIVLAFIIAFGVGFLQGIGMTVIEYYFDHKDDEAK